MTQLNAVTGNQDDRGARARSVRFANSSPLRPGRRTSRISSGGRSLGPTIIVPFADGPHPLHHLHQGAPPCGCFHRGPHSFRGFQARWMRRRSGHGGPKSADFVAKVTERTDATVNRSSAAPALNVRLGSKCEELRVSRTSPVYP